MIVAKFDIATERHPMGPRVEVPSIRLYGTIPLRRLPPRPSHLFDDPNEVRIL